MSRFSRVLLRTAARLDLPQPIKSQVLLEMAADLEDMFSAYRERGLSEAEAELRVTERFDASDDALRDLTRLHSSAFRCWMDRFSAQARTLWERVLLVVILLFVAMITGRLLFSTAFFRDASGFVWPAILIGIAAVGIFLAKVYQLYIKKDHRVRGLRRWLPTLLMLACAAPTCGLFGYFLTLYLTMTRIAEDVEMAGPHFAGWLVGSTATMIVSLLVAILVALFWFLLVNKVARIELAEAALILEEQR
jgi:hypothetical protein